MAQPPLMLFHVTNAVTLCECLALAAVLALWAEKVAGTWLLVLFLGGVSLWIAGNELPAWFGPGAIPAGLLLLCTAPVSSAVFFCFAARFGRVNVGRTAQWSVCVVSVLLGLVAAVLGPGRFSLVPGLGLVAFPNVVGWCATLIWMGLAGAGYALLALAWWRERAGERLQIVAIGLTSLFGALCMTGYGVVVLGLKLAPWPLALLPLYPLLLVYAILRYRVFAANDWAQRALAWGLLSAAGVAMIASVAALPLGLRGVLVAALVLVLAGPARQLAERLIYPGGSAGADDLRHWRAALRAAQNLDDLATRAAALLSQRLNMAVAVRFGGDGPEPALVCTATPEGYHTNLRGWEAAPPGLRRLAGMFGTVLADEAERLAQAQEAAARERDRQSEARLAELGALAATIAHDVRNPLNIIAMASAGAAPELRSEISVQVGRISRLAAELLDYAKPWNVAVAEIDLAPLLHTLARHYPQLAHEAAPGTLRADPVRLEQALTNLLDNASTAPRLHIGAERADGVVRLVISDDGPGIPDDIRDRLFEPFVSRSPGGTGLGLVIVSRIMAAHGGRAMLGARPGWATSFILEFPA